MCIFYINLYIKYLFSVTNAPPQNWTDTGIIFILQVSYLTSLYFTSYFYFTTVNVVPSSVKQIHVLLIYYRNKNSICMNENLKIFQMLANKYHTHPLFLFRFGANDRKNGDQTSHPSPTCSQVNLSVMYVRQ